LFRFKLNVHTSYRSMLLGAADICNLMSVWDCNTVRFDTFVFCDITLCGVELMEERIELRRHCRFFFFGGGAEIQPDTSTIQINSVQHKTTLSVTSGVNKEHTYIYIYIYILGIAVAQWLRCCATNRKVAGSINKLKKKKTPSWCHWNFSLT